MNKKVIALIIMLFGSATLFSYVTTSLLIKLAMDREIPNFLKKGRYSLPESQELKKFFDSINETSEKLKNKKHEIIKIKNKENMILTAHWFKAQKPERIIIAVHGWRSSWSKDFGAISEFWKNNNCSVLYIEQRSQGESEGEYITFGLKERFDCLEWINYINEKNTENLPIYIGGVSMGATTALMCSGEKLPSNIKGIIADCGFISPDAIWRHVINKRFHLPYFFHSYFANSLCKKRIKYNSKNYSTTEALKTNKTPILFIHGADDKLVPIDMTFKNYNACSSPKKLLISPGAGHGMSYFCNKEEYEGAMKEFWSKYK